jgi:hypothetical protein
MALTDAAIRSTKPKLKRFKMYDRNGLFLLVNPSGSRLWRLSLPIRWQRKIDGAG